jgi:hypothetical protein
LGKWVLYSSWVCCVLFQVGVDTSEFFLANGDCCASRALMGFSVTPGTLPALVYCRGCLKFVVQGNVLDPARGLVGEGSFPYVGIPAPMPEMDHVQACSLPCYLCEDQLVRRPVLFPFISWILGAVSSPGYVAMLYPEGFPRFSRFLGYGGRMPITRCPTYQGWWRRFLGKCRPDPVFRVGYWIKRLEWLECSVEMGRGMVWERDFVPSDEAQALWPLGS